MVIRFLGLLAPLQGATRSCRLHRWFQTLTRLPHTGYLLFVPPGLGIAPPVPDRTHCGVTQRCFQTPSRIVARSWTTVCLVFGIRGLDGAARSALECVRLDAAFSLACQSRVALPEAEDRAGDRTQAADRRPWRGWMRCKAASSRRSPWRWRAAVGLSEGNRAVGPVPAMERPRERQFENDAHGPCELYISSGELNVSQHPCSHTPREAPWSACGLTPPFRWHAKAAWHCRRQRIAPVIERRRPTEDRGGDGCAARRRQAAAVHGAGARRLVCPKATGP